MPELILVGDRVLIDVDDEDKQTQAGLYLPATVVEKERVRSGRVVSTGPGYLMPNPDYSESEAWAPHRNAARYLPLQARPGDRALFLRKEAIEIRYDEREYLIVPHGAILALIRPDPDDLDDLPGTLDDEIQDLLD
ncbi:MAG: co-chaperone GroES [Bacteroidetes bacterium]|nr:chaperonin [Rhodothermaceae bacterium RA]RMH60109.1 MAG: co-chaperone GroES [Bacteroidota bacterium]